MIVLVYWNISLNRGGLYVDSPEWLKNKKATINAKNNDNNCCHYATIAALNYKQIKNHPERLTNLKPFINQYNWKGTNFPSHKEDWKKFESKNKSVALNILFVPYNTEKIRLAYKSKHDFKGKSQVILLMITNDKKRHYLAIKRLSSLLKGVASNLLFKLFSLI